MRNLDVWNGWIGCRSMPRLPDMPRDKIRDVKMGIKLCKVLYLMQSPNLEPQLRHRMIAVPWGGVNVT